MTKVKLATTKGGMNRKPVPPIRKPNPKVRQLDPYRTEILLLYREGQSLKDIVEWLAEPPRGIVISRQSVYGWIKTRLARMAKRAEEMKGANLVSPTATFAKASVTTPQPELLLCTCGNRSNGAMSARATRPAKAKSAAQKL